MVVMSIVIPQQVKADISINYNSFRQPIAIMNLESGGLTFNVTIQYSVSFDDKFGTGDPPNIMTPYFWNNAAGASSANTAIVGALNAVPLAPLLSPTFIVTPYMDVATTSVDSFAAVNSGSTYSTTPQNVARNLQSMAVGYAMYEVVPEPSGLGFFAICTAMMFVRRRRQQQFIFSNSKTLYADVGYGAFSIGYH